jgi:hypothetical protein
MGVEKIVKYCLSDPELVEGFTLSVPKGENLGVAWNIDRFTSIGIC